MDFLHDPCNPPLDDGVESFAIDDEPSPFPAMPRQLNVSDDMSEGASLDSLLLFGGAQGDGVGIGVGGGAPVKDEPQTFGSSPLPPVVPFAVAAEAPGAPPHKATRGGPAARGNKRSAAHLAPAAQSAVHFGPNGLPRASPGLVLHPHLQHQQQQQRAHRAEWQRLESIATTVAERREQISSMRALMQPRAIAGAAGAASALPELNAQQAALRRDLEGAAEALRQLQEAALLTPAELALAVALESELYTETEQLRLLSVELAQAMAGHGGVCLASLVIVGQAFPCVVSKGGRRGAGASDPEGLVLVRVLTASSQPVELAAPIEPLLCLQEQGKLAKGSAQQDTIVEKESETAGADGIRIQLGMKSGSRKAPVSVKFSTVANYPGGSVVLESQQSLPFVVITNECQYEVADGALLRRVAFGEGRDSLREVPWPQFANVLQRHFVRATRQELAAAERYLSPRELLFFHTKFFGGRPHITAAMFDNFWHWFGPTIQRLRYTRHVCSMWREGYLWGFTGRGDVEAALAGQQQGTFVVRFSERNAGHFAVSFAVNSATEPVGHYLVKPEDITPTKALPDFLGDHPQLLQVLRVRYDDEGGFSITPMPKETALGTLYSRKERNPTLDGYKLQVSMPPPDPAAFSPAAPSEGVTHVFKRQ